MPKSVGAKGNFGKFWLSEQHAKGYIKLARYDFLLNVLKRILGLTELSMSISWYHNQQKEV